jgi:Zn-dependent peptidase ImmA (M78 family)/transcriptional regulator with XRE-family HTH domain
MIGTPGFVGARLTQARQARALNVVALADLLGLESPSISNYEHGRQTPSPEIMDRLVDLLHQPHAFFLRPVSECTEDIWWRSMSSATKLARSRASARHAWLREILTYLGEYLNFPALNLPAFNLPSDVREITTESIEEMALECRLHWKLGISPVADIVLLLENNGIVVSRGELGAETLDAYSQQPEDSEHAIVFLGAGKASAVRSRHDASHELGHLILHRHINAKAIKNPAQFKLIEEQAHRFASAFNLPVQGFTEQLWAPTLDAFLALKPHWKVSIGAMIMRCAQLDILSEVQQKRAWINLNRKGWRSCEPLDDRLAPEQPRLLRRSFELLVNEGIKTPAQIVSDLCLNPRDIESLACLNHGYLSGEPDQVAVPQLKQDLLLKTGTGNLINFAPRRKLDS